MSKTTLIILIAAVLMFNSCKKNYQSNPSLPPITQSGADTFGCLIDGKVLTPQDNHQSSFPFPCFTCSSPLSVSYAIYDNNSTITYDQQTLMIGATDENPNGFCVYLRVNNMAAIEGQTILLKADSVKKGGSALYNNDIIGNYNLVNYKTTQIVSGELTISKLDQVKKFISGTFKFVAINGNKDTVHVTDGRFDAHYPQ